MMAYVTLGQLFNENEQFERKSKIALLWFDKILVQSFSNSFFVDYLMENNDIREEYEKILRETMIDIPYKIDIYEPSKNIELHNNAREIISDYFGAEYIGKERDVALESNYTSQCIEKWMQLNQEKPYGFIGREIERKIIEKTLYSEQIHNQTNITERLDIAFPSIENMPWNTILELRNHQYIEAFREKINDLQIGLENNDCDVFRELVNEMVQKDLKNVFSLFTPSPSKQLIKGIISNVPSPIPVNPFSIASSIGDIYKDAKLKKHYAWLFFYIENLF